MAVAARRAELLVALNAAGRAHSTVTVMFHTTLAGKLGLSATEEKALDLLGEGPLTAGELAERAGLARASVTALVDRLERKGFARRVPNPEDGRSVLIEAAGDRVARLGPLFTEWVCSLEELYAGYSDAELEVILRFMLESAERQRLSAAKLAAES